MSRPPRKRELAAMELLFPEGGELQQRASHVAELARQLGNPADGEAPIPIEQLHNDFAREASVRAGGAIEDLLCHHLRAIYAGRSFLPLPRPRSHLQAAWEILAARRDEQHSLPGVPEPGEEPLAVAGRLLEGLYRLDWEASVLELWRARLEHAGAGARAGERAFRKRLSECEDSACESRAKLELALGLVASLLDRGDVFGARDVLRSMSSPRSVSTDARLARMRAWAALLTRDFDGARTALSDLEIGDDEWPRPIAELVAAWPAARKLLGGRNHEEIESSEPSPWDATPLGTPLRSRDEVGATLLAVFAFGADRGVELQHIDAPSSARGILPSWIAERHDACLAPSRPEHRLLIEAGVRRVHGECLPSALFKASVGLALIPVLDEDGEVAGWVHLEWDHHLMPDSLRMSRIAASWRLRVLGSRASQAESAWLASDRVSEERADLAGWRSPNAVVKLRREQVEPARRLCAEVFRRLVDHLGTKLTQRRWWGFTHERGVSRYVATGGQGLAGVLDHPGGGRALDRCLATSGVVTFDDLAPHLALHAKSASGMVLPLALAGRVVGILVIESSRRRDFRPAETERAAGMAQSLALALSLALFRAWHVERFGIDLYFDGDCPAFREFAHQVNAAARSGSPVVLSGPAGVGKSVIARWAHWIGADRREALDVWSGALGGGRHGSAAEFAECLRRPGVPLIVDCERSLGPEHQRALASHLDGESGRSGAARGEAGCWPNGGRALILTTEDSLAGCSDRGGLLPELPARLERFQIFVPPLVLRRRDISGLARFFLERFAAQHDCRAPVLTEGAQALLWRQPWPGNLRSLEGFLYKLVLKRSAEGVRASGEHGVEVAELREVARSSQVELLDKLPPRQPNRLDVVQALRSTLKQSGGINKRRAALYLGWDPDTLVARMKEFGLDEANLPEQPHGWLSG